MVRCDALIVGGGPAGSTCARLLRKAGWRALVLDRARFPRDKVCAGWVTPGVFRLLELDPDEYRATGLTIQPITGFRTSVFETGPKDLRSASSVATRYEQVVSYAIRRYEFDNYLLCRAGAQVIDGTPLASFERRGGAWIVNNEIEAPVVIGAGGHFCPVARELRGQRDEARAVVAKEAEFHVEDDDSTVAADMPELFFCRDLEGYGWCVRKGAYLNIGIGRRDNGDLNEHVDEFKQFLERTQKARRATFVRWKGHAYLAWGTGPRPLVADGVLVAGDAAGLAYPESGEGIKPAVESGRLAAETLLAADGDFSAARLQSYERELRRRYPPARPAPRALAGAVRAIGRALMRSPLFTRHVLIDRWFLRST